jgi:hypothetical protein
MDEWNCSVANFAKAVAGAYIVGRGEKLVYGPFHIE